MVELTGINRISRIVCQLAGSYIGNFLCLISAMTGIIKAADTINIIFPLQCIRLQSRNIAAYRIQFTGGV